MTPILWLMLVIILVIIEATTYALTTIWFAAGALAAGIACYLHASPMTQLLIFFGVSLLLLFVTRPLAIKYMKKGMPKTNASSLIGKTAIVIETIDNHAQTGHVRLYDVEWMAVTAADAAPIPEGTVVEICEVHGARLTVKPLQQE